MVGRYATHTSVSRFPPQLLPVFQKSPPPPPPPSLHPPPPSLLLVSTSRGTIFSFVETAPHLWQCRVRTRRPALLYVAGFMVSHLPMRFCPGATIDVGVGST